MRLTSLIIVLALMGTPALAASPVTVTNSSNTAAAPVDGTNGLAVYCTTGCSSASPTVPSYVLMPDSATVTGTIASNSDSVILSLTNGGYSTAGITVTGNGSGTMQVSGSRDCTNYSVTTALPLANGIPLPVISANGSYQSNLAGLKCLKVSGLSIVSGTYTIAISAGVGVGPIMQDNVPWIIGGYTTGASTTGSTATVKAASTAAATTDTSLVVAISPNSNAVKAPASTPTAGTASAIVTGGTALTAVTGPVNGCVITNGLTATDEGVTVEPLYVNTVTTATVQGNTTTFALQPGQSFNCVPGQTTNVSANAATTGHKFTVTVW